MRLDWNDYFMVMAKIASMRSGCNSRPTGCVIVSDKRILATGYNGTLPGKEQCTDKGKNFCYRREQGGPEEDKYNICPGIHAEANAINQAACMGIPLSGSILYCTLSPCYVCLKNLASVGVWKVYFEHKYESEDKERDKLWNDYKKVGIQGIEYRVKLDAISSVIYEVGCIISMRRL